MFIKQLSVFVENKQGALCKIMSRLAENGVNMRAVSIADTQDFGVLRMIVNDTEKAKSVLREHRVIVTSNDVLGVELQDRPGALSEVLNVLGRGGVNIEYMYAFVAPGKEGSAYLVVRPRSNEKAEAILAENGIKMLSEEDVTEM